MTLHPQVAAVLAAAPPAAPKAPTLAEARAEYERGAIALGGEVEDVASVVDVEHGRLYVPDDAVGAVLWLHGGGWVYGSVAAYDKLCRALANRCGAAVLSVEYRLAPETPFPGALEDCEAALAWLASQGFGPLAVAGDSAGGNLATVVARRARDAGGPPLAFQLLVYPVTDAACATGSMQEYGGGEYRLTREQMLELWGMYAPGASARSADASPLRAASLSGMPPALVIVAQYDPLTDEALDYAERLPDAKVSVYDGMVHGFFRWRGAVDAAHVALDEGAAALRSALRA